MRWLEPEAQARLRVLALSPRRAFGGAQAPGRHRTQARGFSRDFAQHRPYAPGDEARSVDWKAYARLDRWFVREFRAEDRVSVRVLLDVSGSMAFAAGGREPKLDAARRLAAATAWLALAQGDEAGLVAISGRTSEVLAARSGSGHLSAFDQALSGLSARGESDLGSAILSAAESLPRRGICVLVSDLLGPTAGVIKALGALASRRDLRVLRVIDPDERDFPYEGPVLLEGLEGGPPLYLDARETAPAYREAFARQSEAYAASLRRSGVPYATAETGTRWDAALARLLSA